MSIDDKQRIAAIETLQALGYSDHFASRSAAPAGTVACTCRTVSDPMHGALMRHANALARYTEGPPEQGDRRQRISGSSIRPTSRLARQFGRGSGHVGTLHFIDFG